MLLWACASPAPPATPHAMTHAMPTFNGAAFEPPVDVQPLTFTRAEGGAFTTADMRGRTSLFFFGYTHCPDVCPFTLADLSQVHRRLGGEAERVDMYFVTLDPARDTPERMQTYLSNFAGITGLIGSDAELTDAEAAFKVVAERRDTGQGDYMVDHTAATYLVNAKAQIQLAYPYGTPPDEILEDVQRLLAAN